MSGTKPPVQFSLTLTVDAPGAPSCFTLRDDFQDEAAMHVMQALEAAYPRLTFVVAWTPNGTTKGGSA